ncbi:beta-1,4-xylanase [Opitutaceae bacterium TAV1]|nr:beta-1,4-xylanase [Opitutaceae bacterium TAV1]
MSRQSLLVFLLSLFALFGPARAESGGQSSESDWFTHLAAGIIRADQGTVELDITFLRPSSELGNGYDFIFRMIPDGKLGETQRTLLGLFVPPLYHPLQGLNLIARDDTSTGTAYWPGLAAPSGHTVRMAFSWGAELRLYVNGQLVSRSSHRAPLSSMPAIFQVSRRAPLRVDNLRVSSVQLPTNRLASGNFTREEDTTLLAGDGLASVATYPTPWHQAELPVAVAPAWQDSVQVFSAGEPVYYPLAGLNYSGSARTIRIAQSITTPGGEHPLVLKHDWTMPPSAAGGRALQHRLPLDALAQPGYYRIKTVIETEDCKPGQVWQSAISVQPAASAPDGALAMYLGHHYEHDYPEAALAMQKAGYRTLREMQNFLWFRVEPEPGRFDWTELDRVVDQLEAAGHDILAVLGNPPTWAAERPSPEIIAGHQNAAMPNRWKPRSLEEWENYVFAVVSRYRGRVKQWEIWNEVDFHPPGRPGSFSGTTQDYFNLLRAAFIQIRRADPAARVLTSGFSLAPVVCDTAMPYDLLAAGAADYFDIFNIHAYNGLQFLEQIDTALATCKPGSPRWMTEHMWHTVPNEKNRMFLSAAFPIWFKERGYDRFYTFGIDEIAFSRRNRSPTVDFHVIAILQSQLRHAGQFTGPLSFPGQENLSVRHGFTLADGRFLSVLGSQVASQRIAFAEDIVSAIDLWGRLLPIVRSGGGASVDIPDLAYIVSAQSPHILSALALEAAPLSHNGGFEEIVGDIGTGGLAAGRPAEWSYREKDYDPDGRIALTTEAHSGSYALEFQNSGQGRVYAFQDITIPRPGLYRLTAWLRRAPSAPGLPYLSLYDRGADKIYRSVITGTSSGEWEKHVLEARFEQTPTKQVAISVGLDAGAPGLVRIDDVALELAEDLAIAREVALPLDLGVAATHAPGDRLVAGPGHPSLSLAPLLREGSGPSTVGRVPFTLPENATRRSLVIVGPGAGLSRDSRPLPVASNAARIAFLHTAMFVRAAPDARLGEYRVTYEDGQTASVPLLNNHALRDWFLAANPGGLEPAGSVISEGGVEYGLFLTLWRNPYPQKRIRHVSLHADDEAILCLLAATADTSAH